MKLFWQSLCCAFVRIRDLGLRKGSGVLSSEVLTSEGIEYTAVCYVLCINQLSLSMKIKDILWSVFFRQFLEQKQKKRLLYFIAAAYHHVSAIKIQRAYRMHLAYKLAENHISSVLIIQVSLINLSNYGWIALCNVVCWAAALRHCCSLICNNKANIEMTIFKKNAAYTQLSIIEWVLAENGGFSSSKVRVDGKVCFLLSPSLAKII